MSFPPNVVSRFFPGVMTTRDFHPQLLGRRYDDDDTTTTIRRRRFDDDDTTTTTRRRRHDDDDTTVVDAMSPIVFAVTADNGTVVGAATKCRPEQSPERQRAGKKLFPWHC